jgi:hypothetical protein
MFHQNPIIAFNPKLLGGHFKVILMTIFYICSVMRQNVNFITAINLAKKDCYPAQEVGSF